MTEANDEPHVEATQAEKIGLSGEGKDLERKGLEVKASKKGNREPPKSLGEFITQVLNGRKISKEDGRVVGKLDGQLSSRDREQILAVAEAKDKDLRATLSLAEFTLEGPGYSRNKDLIFSAVEYIVSNQNSLKKNQTNTIFQAWLDNSCVGTNKLSYFAEQIDRIRVIEEGKTSKDLSIIKRNNILCIAAIWLYFKKAADFSSLISCLSRSAFDIKGQAGRETEAGAFEFATSMITSSKKNKFALFLERYISREENMKAELREKELEIVSYVSRLSSERDNVRQLREDILEKQSQLEELEIRVKALTKEIAHREEAATHADIHHEDSKEEIKVRIARLLEKEVVQLVETARIANLRTPPKVKVVDYQLNEILERIERELEWLRS